MIIVKNRFAWIETIFKDFLFFFFSIKNKYKYRNSIEIFLNFEKTIFKIFLIDVRKFNYILYKIVKKEPLKFMNFFEFLILQLIDSLAFYKFLENVKHKNIQILWIETKKSIKPNKLLSFKTNQLSSWNLEVTLVGKIRIKLLNIVKFFNKKNPKKRKKIFNFRKTDDYVLNFIAYQFVKARENFENNFNLLLEKNLIGRLKLNNTYIFTGIHFVNNFFTNLKKKNINLRNNLSIRILGIYFPRLYVRIFKKELLSSNTFFSNTYGWIYSLILPNIPICSEIKQGIACLFFGATTKFLKNGYRFRGEFNNIFIYNKNKFKSNVFDFIKDLVQNDFFEKHYNHLKANLFSFETKNFSKDIDYVFIGNFFNNLVIFCVENFEMLDLDLKLKIFQFIENQSYYKEEEEMKKKNHTRYSFIFFISEYFFKMSFMHSINKGIDYLHKILLECDLTIFLNKKYNEVHETLLNGHTLFLPTNSSKEDNRRLYINCTKILKQYVNCIRVNITNISLSKNAIKILIKSYAYLRINYKKINNSKNNFLNIKISLKNLETILRISECVTKMRMSNTIDCGDILDAIKIFQQKFSSIQKFLQQNISF
nr:minichromosome maintenance component complex 5-like protein [Cryptomonas paramecium]